jgi:hypothetical protein
MHEKTNEWHESGGECVGVWLWCESSGNELNEERKWKYRSVTPTVGECDYYVNQVLMSLNGGEEMKFSLSVMLIELSRVRGWK